VEADAYLSAVSRRLSACRHSLLGHPAPAEELGLPCGRLTGHANGVADLNGVVTFHTSETRPGWVPSLPRGRWCSPDRKRVSGRHLPLHSGQSLDLTCNIPSVRVPLTRHHRGFMASPVRSSPSPVAAGWNGSPWAWSP